MSNLTTIITPAPLTVLSGHTTMETAYLVDDYPYGFRLRCKIRYWLEYKRGQGFRLMLTDHQSEARRRSVEHTLFPHEVLRD